MKFIQLKDSNSSEFKEAWIIYESSFPANEIRTLKQQKEILKNRSYHFLAVFKDKRLAAIIAYRRFKDFLFLEHLAVKKELRGKCIGTELLKEFLLGKKQKVVLEVEKPKTDIANKRIGFYERIGFKLNPFDYIQPAYSIDKSPVPMLLMTYPEKITTKEFLMIREKLHRIGYGLEKPLLFLKS